jgi:hypothetical protein
MAARADFEEIPEIPAHNTKPINFLLLKPAFGDIKGKLKMDMFTPLNVSFFFYWLKTDEAPPTGRDD